MVRRARKTTSAAGLLHRHREKHDNPNATSRADDEAGSRGEPGDIDRGTVANDNDPDTRAYPRRVKRGYGWIPTSKKVLRTMNRRFASAGRGRMAVQQMRKISRKGASAAHHKQRNK